MTILIIILIVVAVIFIINHNGNKHNEEMRKLAEQKKAAQSSFSQHNINNKIMDAVHAMGDGQNAQYWGGFKRRKPNEAKAIVAASRLNMDSLSDKDAFEVVNTFLRWSENAGKPISKLKEDTIAQLSEFLNEVSFEMLESKLKNEIPKEAKTFQNIKMMNKLYESGKVDKNEFDQMLEETLDKFAHQF